MNIVAVWGQLCHLSHWIRLFAKSSQFEWATVTQLCSPGRVRSYCRESDFASRWVHKESNFMFTFSNDKEQRKKFDLTFPFVQCKWTLTKYTFSNLPPLTADRQESMNSPGNLSLLNSPMVLPWNTQSQGQYYHTALTCETQCFISSFWFCN